MAMTISGRKVCIREIPAALMAVNSLLSPKFPKVIKEDSRMARGNAWGISISHMYHRNWAITSSVRPFPIRSSTYRHKNCIISTNWQMKKVPTNNSANCLVINMSNFLIRNIISLQRYCKKLRLHPISPQILFFYHSFFVFTTDCADYTECLD